MTTIPLIYFLIVLLDSWTDAVKAALIRHFRGAVLYAAACSAYSAFVLAKTPGINIKALILWSAVFAVLTRLAWFDPFFNNWTNQPFGHNGAAKKENPSITDNFENWLIQKTNISIFWLRVIYIILWAVAVIIFYIKN